MKDVGSSNGEMMRRGRVEVVCGSMFSGKTEELIRRLRRAQFAKQKVEIFKPAIDVRYSEEEARREIPAIQISCRLVAVLKSCSLLACSSRFRLW